jgi:hypothetical protein
LVTVTVAPGTTAPWASDTTPSTVAVDAWPSRKCGGKAAENRRQAESHNRNPTPTNFANARPFQAYECRAPPRTFGERQEDGRKRPHVRQCEREEDCSLLLWHLRKCDAGSTRIGLDQSGRNGATAPGGGREWNCIHDWSNQKLAREMVRDQAENLRGRGAGINIRPCTDGIGDHLGR